MPLVLICGFPASGKTTRSHQLRDYILSQHPSKKVHIVNDHPIDVVRDNIYSDSHKEREFRANLKSSAQRLLTKEVVVIVDSVNYIKGFRYELYCTTKSCRTPHCVVYCVTDPETSKKWNMNREGDKYSNEVMDELIRRFECPSGNNRWDSPLFSVYQDGEMNLQEICDALFERKAPAPNFSTQSQPLSSTNFLYELDKKTLEIVTSFMARQKDSVPGDVFRFPGSDTELTMSRNVSLGELQRHRRQFIAYTKTHPLDNLSKLPNLFLQYLAKSLDN